MVIMSANFKSYSSVHRIVKLILYQKKDTDDELSEFTNDLSDSQSDENPRYTAILRNLDLLSLPTSDASFVENMKYDQTLPVTEFCIDKKYGSSLQS